MRPPGGGRSRPLYRLVVEDAASGALIRESRTPPAAYPLESRETIIGRDPSCTVRLDDHFVSRRHARLLLRGNTIHLDDLNSTNSTRLNGNRVETRMRVRPGDRLRFGPVGCRIERAIAPTASASPEGPLSGHKSVAEKAASTSGAAAAAGSPARPDRSSGSPVEAAAADNESSPRTASSGGPDQAVTASQEPQGETSEAGDVLPPGGRRDEPVSESTAIVDQWTEPDAGIREPAAAKVGTVPAAGVASRADGDPWTDPAPPEAPEDAEVFLAGPLPGEPRRTRVRLGLWTGTIVLLFVFALVLWR